MRTLSPRIFAAIAAAALLSLSAVNSTAQSTTVEEYISSTKSELPKKWNNLATLVNVVEYNNSVMLVLQLNDDSRSSDLTATLRHGFTCPGTDNAALMRTCVAGGRHLGITTKLTDGKRDEIIFFSRQSMEKTLTRWEKNVALVMGLTVKSNEDLPHKVNENRTHVLSYLTDDNKDIIHVFKVDKETFDKVSQEDIRQMIVDDIKAEIADPNMGTINTHIWKALGISGKGLCYVLNTDGTKDMKGAALSSLGLARTIGFDETAFEGWTVTRILEWFGDGEEQMDATKLVTPKGFENPEVIDGETYLIYSYWVNEELGGEKANLESLANEGKEIIQKIAAGEFGDDGPEGLRALTFYSFGLRFRYIGSKSGKTADAIATSKEIAEWCGY